MTMAWNGTEIKGRSRPKWRTAAGGAVASGLLPDLTEAFPQSGQAMNEQS